MNKQQFLLQLREKLQILPEDELEERVAFYGEMIDDRIEEGLGEEDAVEGLGSADSVAAQIIDEIPLSKLVKDKIRLKKKPGRWTMILLVLGSPLWLPLVFALAAVIFSVWISLWSAVLSLWCGFVAAVAVAFGSIAAGVFFAAGAQVYMGAAMAGAGIFTAGVAIFIFFGCKAVTKGLLLLTKKTLLCIKALLLRKGDA